MKVVILAGGKGTRLQEETYIKPKPLIEIGSKPLIWHIMKLYSKYGFKEFIICCGHKGYMIKEYFKNFLIHNSDITVDVKKNKIKIHKNRNEDWKITLIDTGEDTQTGGRILRVKDLVGEKFLLTYGDGLSNINIKKLVNYHKQNKKLATIIVVQPFGRFGAVKINQKIIWFKIFRKNERRWWLDKWRFFVLEKKFSNISKMIIQCGKKSLLKI